MGWKTLDKSSGVLPVFLSGGFEILHSANKQLGGLRRDVWLIALYVWSRQDLREKNWKAMEALTTVEKACEEKLLAATKAKVSLVFLFSSDAGGIREAFSLPEPPEMLALGCLPPLRSGAGPTLLPASPKFVLRTMYPRYRSWSGNWEDG